MVPSDPQNSAGGENEDAACRSTSAIALGVRAVVGRAPMTRAVPAHVRKT